MAVLTSNRPPAERGPAQFPPCCQRTDESSPWPSQIEAAIKHALHGKRTDASFTVSGTEAQAEFRLAGFRFLSITAQHAAAVDALPPHRRDPSDRLLVAQSLCEPLRLVTAERALAR